MKLVNKTSLAETIDNITDAFFLGNKIPKEERDSAALFIASRQGLLGSYANLFAPTEKDSSEGIKLFTGETVRPSAALRHIIGEESCRALILLKSPLKVVKDTFRTANESMIERMRESIGVQRPIGWYCCGQCTVSFWRNLLVGGLENQEAELAGGLKILKSLRDGKHGWRRMPFYYTLLALNEFENPLVIDELKYAAPRFEDLIGRKPRKDKYSIRRHVLAERVLKRL
jgi:hypothetical protein